MRHRRCRIALDFFEHIAAEAGVAFRLVGLTEQPIEPLWRKRLPEVRLVEGSAMRLRMVANPEMQIRRGDNRHRLFKGIPVSHYPRPHAVGKSEKRQNRVEPAVANILAVIQIPKQADEAERQ